MAINATPLNAYKLNVLSSLAQQAANRREMNEGLGAIAEGIDEGLNQRKARDFFAQFDDNEEIRLEEEIKSYDEQINELKKELEKI
jgi:SMC interacting uncharacterized protein involved in chromosome segregation